MQEKKEIYGLKKVGKFVVSGLLGLTMAQVVLPLADVEFGGVGVHAADNLADKIQVVDWTYTDRENNGFIQYDQKITLKLDKSLDTGVTYLLSSYVDGLDGSPDIIRTFFSGGSSDIVVNGVVIGKVKGNDRVASFELNDQFKTLDDVQVTFEAKNVRGPRLYKAPGKTPTDNGTVPVNASLRLQAGTNISAMNKNASIELTTKRLNYFAFGKLFTIDRNGIGNTKTYKLTDKGVQNGRAEVAHTFNLEGAVRAGSDFELRYELPASAENIQATRIRTTVALTDYRGNKIQGVDENLHFAKSGSLDEFFTGENIQINDRTVTLRGRFSKDFTGDMAAELIRVIYTMPSDAVLLPSGEIVEEHRLNYQYTVGDYSNKYRTDRLDMSEAAIGKAFGSTSEGQENPPVIAPPSGSVDSDEVDPTNDNVGVPSINRLDDMNEGERSVTGTTVPNVKTVIVDSDGQKLGETISGKTGTYTVSLNRSLIRNERITSKAGASHETKDATKTVTPVLAETPQMNTLNTMADGDEEIRGNTAPNTKVVIEDARGVAIGQGNSGPNGAYVVRVNRPLKGGETITSKAGEENNSKDATGTVRQGVPSVNGLNEMNEDDERVSGKTEPNTRVVITDAQGTTLGQGQSGQDGNYSVEVNRPLRGKEVIRSRAGVYGSERIAEGSVIAKPKRAERTVPFKVEVTVDPNASGLNETRAGRDGTQVTIDGRLSDAESTEAVNRQVTVGPDHDYAKLVPAGSIEQPGTTDPNALGQNVYDANMDFGTQRTEGQNQAGVRKRTARFTMSKDGQMTGSIQFGQWGEVSGQSGKTTYHGPQKVEPEAPHRIPNPRLKRGQEVTIQEGRVGKRNPLTGQISHQPVRGIIEVGTGVSHPFIVAEDEFIRQGEDYNPGRNAFAWDHFDGSVRLDSEASSTFDTNRVGVYTVSHKARNSLGNEATKETKVYVLSNYSERFKQLNEGADALGERLAEVEKQAGEFEKELAAKREKLMGDLDALNAPIKELSDKLDELDKDLTIEEGKYEERARAIEDVKRQQKEINEKLDGIENDLNALRERVKANEGAIDGLGKGFDRVKETLDGLREDMRALDGHMNSMAHRLMTAESLTGRLEDIENASRESLDKATESVDQLEKDAQGLEKGIQDADQSLATWSEFIRGEVTKQRGILDEIRDLLRESEHENEKNGLRHRINVEMFNHLDTRAGYINEGIGTLENLVKFAEDKLKEQDAWNEQAEQLLQTAKDNIERNKGFVADLTASLEANKKAYEQTKHDLEHRWDNLDIKVTLPDLSERQKEAESNVTEDESVVQESKEADKAPETKEQGTQTGPEAETNEQGTQTGSEGNGEGSSQTGSETNENGTGTGSESNGEGSEAGAGTNEQGTGTGSESNGEGSGSQEQPKDSESDKIAELERQLAEDKQAREDAEKAREQAQKDVEAVKDGLTKLEALVNARIKGYRELDKLDGLTKDERDGFKDGLDVIDDVEQAKDILAEAKAAHEKGLAARKEKEAKEADKEVDKQSGSEEQGKEGSASGETDTPAGEASGETGQSNESTGENKPTESDAQAGQSGEGSPADDTSAKPSDDNKPSFAKGLVDRFNKIFGNGEEEKEEDQSLGGRFGRLFGQTDKDAEKPGTDVKPADEGSSTEETKPAEDKGTQAEETKPAEQGTQTEETKPAEQDGQKEEAKPTESEDKGTQTEETKPAEDKASQTEEAKPEESKPADEAKPAESDDKAVQTEEHAPAEGGTRADDKKADSDDVIRALQEAHKLLNERQGSKPDSGLTTDAPVLTPAPQLNMNQSLEALKADAIKQINGFDQLTDAQKEAFIKQVNEATDAKGVQAVLAEAVLTQAKVKAVGAVEAASALSAEEKAGFNKRIAEAKDIATVEQILRDVQLANEKASAKGAVADLDQLSPERKDDYTKQIDGAKDALAEQKVNGGNIPSSAKKFENTSGSVLGLASILGVGLLGAGAIGLKTVKRSDDEE